MSAAQAAYEWKDVPWARARRAVFKLQKRIYRASQAGDVRAIHRLQRLLTRSWSARLLAVRRVAQDNAGKRTAGVDGVRSLRPPQRLRLAQGLSLAPRPKPARRVWIPKPDSGERRPLGIPTLADRARQALVKLALEPEWEARFEPNSYGFRPGRSAQDAVQAIFASIALKAKYVLDADIAKCFDRIDHPALLAKLATYPSLRRVVRRWLKAGVLEGDELFPTEAGTPQGGVLSPLLANVALHGLETHIRSAYPASYRRESWRPTVVRYADDFVVLHPDRRVVEQIRAEVGAWLTPLGLELKPAKTRIAHTLNRLAEDEAPGFDFLGFRVRQYPCGKAHAGKASRGRGRAVPKGFKTLVTPSQSAQKRHQAALGEIVRSHRGATQAELIRHLNPVTRGWSGYFRAMASKRTFSKMAHLLFRKLWRWARRRHPRKSRRWVARTYWRPASGRWDFATPDGARLYEHPRMRIVRHTKVRGNRSPFDGDSVYWSARLGRFPDLPPGLARRLKRQKGRCAACGMFLTPDDVRALDQPEPDPQGGPPRPPRPLVHRHCGM